MEKGQSFLESVSWPNESLVAKHFRLERKHRITTITHGLANRCLTIRLSAPDVSLSFQSASHFFYLGSSRWSNDIYLGIIRIQTITYPRLYFCCMLITAFYTPHTNLTSSSHTTQPVSTGFSEWTSFHITTLYTRLASVLWRTRLPSTR